MFPPAQYVCDLCQCVLESENERYVFRVVANVEMDCREVEEGMIDSDRDYLQEIDDLLERGKDLENVSFVGGIESPSEYHLCRECRQRFVPESFDRRNAQLFDFSNR